MNFEPDFWYKIPTEAKDILGFVDRGIELYETRNKPCEQLRLFARHWDALEKTVKAQSNGEASLKTHTYRGVKLVRTK